MQEMLLTDDPKIVNGSKLSKEELKQLLKKPSPKLEKAVLFCGLKRKTALFRAAFRTPKRETPKKVKGGFCDSLFQSSLLLRGGTWKKSYPNE